MAFPNCIAICFAICSRPHGTATHPALLLPRQMRFSDILDATCAIIREIIMITYYLLSLHSNTQSIRSNAMHGGGGSLFVLRVVPGIIIMTCLSTSPSLACIHCIHATIISASTARSRLSFFCIFALFGSASSPRKHGRVVDNNWYYCYCHIMMMKYDG